MRKRRDKCDDITSVVLLSVLGRGNFMGVAADLFRPDRQGCRVGMPSNLSLKKYSEKNSVLRPTNWRAAKEKFEGSYHFCMDF